MRLETAVLRALALVGRDPSLQLALPVVLARNADSVDWSALVRRVQGTKLETRLGMLLDLTAAVTPARVARRYAKLLSPSRGDAPTYLPKPRSRFDAALADLKTPASVRRWGFRVNVAEASFRDFARKHLGQA